MNDLNPFSSGPPDDWNAYRRFPYLLARLAFIVAILLLIYVTLQKAAGVLSMIFASTLLAYVLDPVVDRMERWRIPRTTAIVLLMVGAVLVTVVFAVWMIPTIVREFSEVGARVRLALKGDPMTWVRWAEQQLGVTLDKELVADLKGRLEEALPTILSHVGQFLQGAAEKTMGIVGWLLNIVMIPIFTFYFLRDFDIFRAWVIDVIPRKYKDAVVDRGRRIDGVVGDWLRGQVQVALLLAIIYATGLAIVGIPIAIPIGILAGILSVVPYLGFAFGFGLALLMALLDWTGIGRVIGVSVVFVVAQILEGYVLTPKIVGEKVGLSAVAVIIVLLLGGELFGLLGFMLAVPIAGVVKTILVELLDWYRSSEAYLGRHQPKEDGNAL
jgi:predicted PurR-regulated permease PerM